jgi:hypothetical protein
MLTARQPSAATTFAMVRAREADAVDDLPIWVRWIIVAVIGLSPILTFWMAGVLGRYLRHRRRRGSHRGRRARLARQKQRNSDDNGGQPNPH